MKKLIIAVVLSAVLVTPAFAEDRYAQVYEGADGGGSSEVISEPEPETPSETRGGGGGGLSRREKLQRELLKQYLSLLQVYYELLLQLK